jgi:hypothetical protein
LFWKQKSEAIGRIKHFKHKPISWSISLSMYSKL